LGAQDVAERWRDVASATLESKCFKRTSACIQAALVIVQLATRGHTVLLGELAFEHFQLNRKHGGALHQHHFRRG
jgi:hypothetical protein